MPSQPESSANNRRDHAAAQLLRIPEVADVLGCTSRHVYNLIAAGMLATVNIALKGSVTRISTAEVDRYIKAQTTKPRRQAAS